MTPRRMWLNKNLADHLAACSRFCPQVAKSNSAALSLKALFYVPVYLQKNLMMDVCCVTASLRVV